MEKDYARTEHLKMIQEVIKRMGTNSFAMKGWAVALVTGFFVLDTKLNSMPFLLLAIIPLIMFWFLDSYYLQQERLFRSLYEEVRTSQEDFNFDMNTKSYKTHDGNSFSSAFWSNTEVWFYLVLIIIVVCVSLVSIIRSSFYCVGFFRF